MGPKMKPRPKAAPMRPKLFARFSAVETSDAYALATEKLAPDAPPTTRATNINASDGARPSNRKCKPSPSSDQSNTGRRPKRSDKAPSKGAQKNCIKP